MEVLYHIRPYNHQPEIPTISYHPFADGLTSPNHPNFHWIFHYKTTMCDTSIYGKPHLGKLQEFTNLK